MLATEGGMEHCQAKATDWKGDGVGQRVAQTWCTCKRPVVYCAMWGASVLRFKCAHRGGSIVGLSCSTVPALVDVLVLVT